MKYEKFFIAAFIAAALGLMVLFGITTWRVIKHPPQSAPSASTKPPEPPIPSVFVPVDPAMPPESPRDREEDLALARKNNMLERCSMAGGLSVIGYGWRVVCLKPSSAIWWDDPKLPEGKR